MSWTDERVELLKKLWSDGLSASQIAAELGGITRNAVIGKVHRLGLSGRAKSPSTRRAAPAQGAFVVAHAARGRAVDPRQYRAGARLRFRSGSRAGTDRNSFRSASAAPSGTDRTDLPLAGRRSRRQRFLLLRRRHRDDLPYCAFHSRVAYQPVTDRRRDNVTLLIRG